MPSATSCGASASRAAGSPASYSPFDNAPARQPKKLPRSARSAGVRRSVVVRDRHLRVHEVVQVVAVAVRRRFLAGEAPAAEDSGDEGQLPGGVAV
jgi:hypothetical protein